jgi:hypothetical protein
VRFPLTSLSLHRLGVINSYSDIFFVSLFLYSKGFDLVSGYRHKPIPEGSTMTLEELRKGGYVLTESQWMTRILFLETIAGVPGFFAAMIRHLRGLRSLVCQTICIAL